MGCYYHWCKCNALLIYRYADQSESGQSLQQRLSQSMRSVQNDNDSSSWGTGYFYQEKGSCKLFVWEKTEFSWGQARDGSAEQPRPQTLKRAHEDVHPRRCTRAPTLMAGWPFPLKFWRRLFQKDIASLKCSSLLLQKEICWDRTAFISPETTASAEQGFKEHRAPLMTEQSELFVLSPDFHPQCGVGHREAGPCFLPTLAQWAGKKLSFPPMTSWKFSMTGFREAEIPQTDSVEMFSAEIS